MLFKPTSHDKAIINAFEENGVCPLEEDTCPADDMAFRF
jgi:hypothetical protein